jgi:hypothetical protein
MYREINDPTKRVLCFLPATSGSVANGVGQDVLATVYVISRPIDNEDLSQYEDYLDSIECASEDNFEAVPNVTIRANYRSRPVQTEDDRIVTEFLFTIR